MEKPSRYIVALVLTVIYLLINLGSLAPLALASATITNAVTGECFGNCDLCGCSAERRANHTCCCLKKQKQEHDRLGVPECCKNKKRHKMTLLTSNCPCGSNKLPGLMGAENSVLLPYRFAEGVIALDEDSLAFLHRYRLTERHGDPPDPLPKITILS